MSVTLQQKLFNWTLIQGPLTPEAQSHFSETTFKQISIDAQIHLFIAHDNVWQRCTDSQGHTHIVIGELFTWNPLEPDTSDGQFVGIHFDHHQKSLRVYRNKNSHIGVYYMTGPQRTYLSSHLTDMYRWLKNTYPLSICPDAVMDFFTYGFVSLGRTPFQRIYQLGYREQLTLLGHGHIDITAEKDVSFDLELINHLPDLFEFILDRIALYLNKSNINSIAISGGLDSRLIATCILMRDIQRPFRLYSRLHPQLMEFEDRDVFLAKKVAEILKTPLHIQKAVSSPTAFLSQEPPCIPPILSGLYGGEYLGGEIYRLINLKSLYASRGDCTTDFLERLDHHRIPGTHNLDLKVRLLAQSSLCNIYEGSWIHISAHHNLTLSPFTDTFLVELISKTNLDHIIDYKKYRDLFTLFHPSLKQIPINGHINVYYRDYPITEKGLDPKKMQAPESNLIIDDSTMDCLPEPLRSVKLSIIKLRAFQNFLKFADIF